MPIRWVEPKALKTSEPFVSCFTVEDEILARITNHMREHGWDEAEGPLTIGDGSWPGAPCLVDGHTRLRAAVSVGIDKVPVVTVHFPSLWDAIAYAYHRQADRRQATEAQLARVVEILDRLRPRGPRPGKSPDSFSPIGEKLWSHDATAAAAGTSGRKVSRLRQVAKHPDLHDQVKAGKLSIYKASTMAANRDRAVKSAAVPEKVTRSAFTIIQWNALSDDMARIVIDDGRNAKGKHFNRQTGTDIDWAKWSWNPVSGCLHPCPYCYARDIAQSMHDKGLYPNNFMPTLYPELLAAPFCTPIPATAATDETWRNVFTCSMADLFGRWVPDSWIAAVMRVVEKCPQWNFLFLTKFPKRYADLDHIPENAWLGTTVDCQIRVASAEAAFEKFDAKVKWLSLEPMLEPLKFKRLDLFNWLVLGGASASRATGKTHATPEWHPPVYWWGPLAAQARDLGIQVYEKTNLYARAVGTPTSPEPYLHRAPEAFNYLGNKDRTTITEGEAPPAREARR